MRRKSGFIFAELLVFSLLLAIVSAGITQVVGMVVKGSAALVASERDVLAFSSLIAEARAGLLDGTKGGDRFEVAASQASGVEGDCEIKASFDRGSVTFSWRRRDVKARR